MIRTRTWIMAGIVLGSALVAGTILAQSYGPKPPANPSAPASPNQPAAPSEQSGPRIYNLVTADSLGIASSAQQMFGHFVKVQDVFYDEVTAFPDDAVRAGFTPQKYYAFLTRPDGSDLICFIPLQNPDVAALKAAQPVRGSEIFIMGQVGPHMFVGEGGATAISVDRLILGHEEPKAVKPAEKKPVILTIERFGPAANVVKQDFTISTPGQRYVIHDLSDPQNWAKDIYITLQF